MPSKMTKEERAEYQREYRKRQRREQVMNTTMPAQAVRELIDAEDRIKVLEGEVRQLKRELAGRTGRVVGVHKPEPIILDLTPTAGTPRFGAPRPAPKPGAKKR